MEFLGALGIDWKLLIAQIVNFGLLLWLLTKFLYKPIIKRIEKDEKELEQAQIQNEELTQDKNSFAEQKEKARVEMQRQVQEIIKEANDIALEIKQAARKKADSEVLAIIKQTKGKLESLQPDIEKEIFKKAHAKIGISFKESFIGAVPLSLQKEFQNVFWSDFIKQVRVLTLPELKNLNLVGIVEKFKKERETKKNAPKKESDKIFTQKIGAVILESVYPLAPKQGEELEKMISEKTGVKLNIIKKQNKDLINGFRFEIAGIIIESNLLNIINDASNFKK